MTETLLIAAQLLHSLFILNIVFLNCFILEIVTWFFLSTFSVKTLPYVPFLPFKLITPFWKLIVVRCMYGYGYIGILLNINNQHSPYDVTCVYVFRDEHLVLDSQSVCSSLGKTILPLSAPFSAMIFRIYWDLMDFPLPSLACLLLLPLFNSRLDSLVGETLWI